VEIQQAFKYEVSQTPGSSGACIASRAAAVECSTWLWGLQIANREAGEKYIRYASMAKNLSTWRRNADTAWLSEAPFHTLCNKR
jgi:putative transposase